MAQELYHYGVKGMKWGVRRSSHKSSRAKRSSSGIKKKRSTEDLVSASSHRGKQIYESSSMNHIKEKSINDSLVKDRSEVGREIISAIGSIGVGYIVYRGLYSIFDLGNERRSW